MIDIKIDYSLDCDFEDSKFFGTISLPEKWLNDNVFSPEEIFICQINLSQLQSATSCELLPKSGTLFFFVDYKKRPYKPVIRYFDGEMDDVVTFNDDIECDIDVIEDLPISFCGSNENVGEMLSSFGDDICLLKIYHDDIEPILPFGCDISFVINKKDLAERNFSKAKLIMK